MSMHLRLLGIAAVMSGFGLSEALPAGDVWKGSWKFEIDRQASGLRAAADDLGRRQKLRATARDLFVLRTNNKGSVLLRAAYQAPQLYAPPTVSSERIR
jgi:hypothetical protein